MCKRAPAEPHLASRRGRSGGGGAARSGSWRAQARPRPPPRTAAGTTLILSSLESRLVVRGLWSSSLPSRCHYDPRAEGDAGRRRPDSVGPAFRSRRKQSFFPFLFVSVFLSIHSFVFHFQGVFFLTLLFPFFPESFFHSANNKRALNHYFLSLSPVSMWFTKTTICGYLFSSLTAMHSFFNHHIISLFSPFVYHIVFLTLSLRASHTHHFHPLVACPVAAVCNLDLCKFCFSSRFISLSFLHNNILGGYMSIFFSISICLEIHNVSSHFSFLQKCTFQYLIFTCLYPHICLFVFLFPISSYFYVFLHFHLEYSETTSPPSPSGTTSAPGFAEGKGAHADEGERGP